MASITLAINDKLNTDISKFTWLNLSELVKQELIRRQEILNKINSEEEKELIRWSIELGRKAKKESFKKIISELSPEEREKLLK